MTDQYDWSVICLSVCFFGNSQNWIPWQIASGKLQDAVILLWPLYWTEANTQEAKSGGRGDYTDEGRKTKQHKEEKVNLISLKSGAVFVVTAFAHKFHKYRRAVLFHFIFFVVVEDQHIWKQSCRTQKLEIWTLYSIAVQYFLICLILFCEIQYFLLFDHYN